MTLAWHFLADTGLLRDGTAPPALLEFIREALQGYTHWEFTL